MSTETAIVQESSKLRPGITLLMVLCGLVGTAAVGVASAAPAGATVPQIAVKYDAQELNTDAGAKELYRKLVKASEAVCPDIEHGSRLISTSTQQCRRESLSRAVLQINDPRLAAIGNPHLKTG